MKTTLKWIATASLMLLNIFYAQAQNALTKPKREVLLIGTFHFDNPGKDVVQSNTFNILTPGAQQNLEDLSQQIQNFHPDKFFVEWEYQDEKKLDSLYNLYRQGKYNTHMEEHYAGKNLYNFYTQSEIFQLGFRAAKKSGLIKVNSMDYSLSLPFDSVMSTLKAAGQTEILDSINALSAAMAKNTNLKRKTLNLTQLLLDLNTAASRRENAGFYIKTLNKAGKPDNFIGADAVAAWYKRNLYMYALVQKQLQDSDRKIVILLGAGHVAMIKKFIEDEGEFKVVELKDLK